MNILLVGGGGREHALAWKIAGSPLLKRLVAAPGNPGIASVAEVRPIGVVDIEGQAALAREMAADLVVIGPEAALAAGLADRLAADGIACFGASERAARIETSKAYMKDFAARYGIPTAPSATFAEAPAAKASLARFTPPYVIKDDGLAAGKGVVIANDLAAARAAIDASLRRKGSKVVIEAFMEGEEVSQFALCDGSASMAFGEAQDHKRAFDGDEGPNTGGMGAFSPALAVSASQAAAAERTILAPAFDGLAAEGSPYRGVLYAGLMLTADGPRLVEFNARFGDPECQVLMMRLESDIVPYLAATATGALSGMAPPRWREGAAICVVLAAQGYPQAPRTGSEIFGADTDFGDDVVIFHAATARRADGALIAAGGRVLNVCARGPDLRAARERAYAAVEAIDWVGGFHRTDIGARALGWAASGLAPGPGPG